MRAEARVEQWGSQGRVRGTVMMFVERPNRVRFDVMTQFGPAAVLTSSGEDFALMDLRENRFFSGPPCPSNIARLLGIPLTADAILQLLVGDSPRLDSASSTISCEDGQYRIRLEASGGQRQTLDFALPDGQDELPPSEQHLDLMRSEVLNVDGSVHWRATWEDYREVQSGSGTVRLPFRVRFVNPAMEADTEVRFRDIDLNPEIPGDAFHQQPRDGLPTEWLSCDPGA